MIDQDQVVNRKSALTRLTNQAFPDFDRQVGPSRQDPKIIVRWACDEGVTIVLLIECEHVIAAGKRPEESGRETGDGFLTLEPRGAIGFFPSTLLAVDAIIEHADRPIIPQFVSRSHVG